MDNFVWILEASKSTSFGVKGVSSSYILPKGSMLNVKPESLAGVRIWVLLRGDEDRLLLSFKTKKIEKILEGYNQNDCLVRTDLLSSFRLVSNYDEAIKYRTEKIQTLQLGIHSIDNNIIHEFIEIVTDKIPVKLANPDGAILADLDLKILPNSGGLLAISAVRMIVSEFNLNQLWASGKGLKLGAYSNFGKALATQKIDSHDIAFENLNFGDCDPLAILKQEGEIGSTSPLRTSKRLHTVDTELTVVSPNNIYAREFLASGNQYKDLESSINKTERAEKFHQDMLKDISEYVISMGIVPYESGSIDLFFDSGEELRVCEIKSTTTENIMMQAAKGSFQLACYTSELEHEYDSLVAYLILEKLDQTEIEQYISQILSRFDIRVLYYNQSVNWPNRVRGLI